MPKYNWHQFWFAKKLPEKFLQISIQTEKVGAKIIHQKVPHIIKLKKRSKLSQNKVDNIFELNIRQCECIYWGHRCDWQVTRALPPSLQQELHLQSLSTEQTLESLLRDKHVAIAFTCITFTYGNIYATSCFTSKVASTQYRQTRIHYNADERNDTRFQYTRNTTLL